MLRDPWSGLGGTFATGGRFFNDFLKKRVVLLIRCRSRAEVLYLQVPASKLEPLGLKSRIVELLWRLLGALATVEFEALCRSYGTNRKSGQTQIKAEVKVYLSDNSYD